MGLQSYKFPIDFMNNLEPPVIYVAKKNKEILGSVSIYDDLSLTFNLNAYQEASFKIFRDIDGEKQDNFDLFQEDALIMIPGISWYKIHVETNIEQTGITRSVSATSLECMLCNKRLVDFQINSDDAEEENAVAIKFYNAGNPEASLLNKILNVSPSWTVGHVDESLMNKLRIFDVSDTDVYSFLTSDVSEAFNCLVLFDTFNQTVNAYDLDAYGKDSNIYISMDNLAESMTETIDENSIITCYLVTGGNDIDISEVNPNGTKRIYNFDYYMPQFSSTLQQKLKMYNEKYQELKDPYEKVVAELQAQLEKIQDLYTRSPLSTNSTDWTQYGLYLLQSQQKSYQNINDVYCTQGMNDPTSFQYNLYMENLQLLNYVTAELNVRQNEVNIAENEYKSIIVKLQTIQGDLDMDKWFTVDEWKELDAYVVEESYSDDSYSVENNTTESELFSMEKQLYDAAWKDLNKKCRPQYQYSSTLANILTIPEFKSFVDYFELGNFIMMETDENTLVKLRLISFTIDYSNTSNIDVTFSDAIRVHDIYEDASSIQSQAHSAAMSFKFNKNQYDRSVSQGNFVAEMRKFGLDVATTQIHNSKNQSQVWDETGMTFRQWNEQRQDYDPEQIKIINNLIAISDDGFNKSTVTAIGKIPIDKNGNYGWGINAQVLMSKLVMSENLWIENDSGNYKFDDSGFNATNGTNTVKIQPNNSGELFSIYKGNSKKFYVDADGNLHFEGDLTGATGTFSGNISGGSINIGNGTFTVDQNGYIYASKGTFSGDITGASVTGSDITGSTITGGVISGASITGGSLFSSGVNGSTLISGGTMTLNAQGQNLGMINVKYGTFETYITPFALYAEASGDGYSQRTVVNSGQVQLRQGNVETNIFSSHIDTPQINASTINVTQSIMFSGNATRYGTLEGTTDRLVFRANGGNQDIPSVGWVRGFVSAQANSFYNTGYSKGVSYGQSVGYNSGYSTGYSTGYSVGYAAGVAIGSIMRK